MASENSSTELILENDPRLIRGIGSVVEHIGEHVAMPRSSRRELAEAAEKTCLASFPLIGNHNATLRVVVQDFPDRIEVTLEFPEVVPEAAACKAAAGTRVDRVQLETVGGHTRTTLVKLVSNAPPQS